MTKINCKTKLTQNAIFGFIMMIMFVFGSLYSVEAALLTDVTGAIDAIDGIGGNDKDGPGGGGTTNVNAINVPSLNGVSGPGAFGFTDWDFLQKINTPGGTDTVTDIGLAVTGGGTVNNGTWSVTPSAVSGYSDIMIALKQARGFNLYLLPTSVTSGSWTSSMVQNGNGLSHFSVYARGISGSPVSNTPVPEPGTFALLGIGLTGLGIIHRRKKNEYKNIL